MSENPITVCQKCAFAEYVETEQVGCFAGALSMLPVIEAYNEEGEFYVVDGVCPYHRTKDWLQNKLETCDDMNTIIGEMKENTYIQYNAIIMGRDNLEDIIRSVSQVKEIDCEPSKVIVLTFLNEDGIKQLQEYLNGCKFRLWQIENQIDDYTNQDLIRRTINHHRNHWHLLIEAGVNDVSKDFIKRCSNRFFFNQEEPAYHMKDKATETEIIMGKLFMLNDHKMPETGCVYV